MRIALVAPPFIAVPPKDYGGTELFVAQLAEGLQQQGIEVVVYANGDSTVNVERHWRYEHSQWPIKSDSEAWLKEMDHTSWAVEHAARHNCELIHVQSALALTYPGITGLPTVLTLHGPNEAKLTELYHRYRDTYYVCISQAQSRKESMPRTRVIHHGIDLSQYRLYERKQNYLSFIGRIAPIKGTHIAIEVAKRTGIPLKMAGEVQPLYRDYFEAKIKPEIDGKLVEYIGPANLESKNELLGNSMAMLFPIQWHEPFGLVMVEAMACGTPVLALPGGSVPEVVRDGVSGYVCRSVRELSKRALNLQFDPASLRRYVEEHFSTQRMVAEYADLYREAVSGRDAVHAA
jgi:glycosyltransferase involved in cell wall biosynthesis